MQQFRSLYTGALALALSYDFPEGAKYLYENPHNIIEATTFAAEQTIVAATALGFINGFRPTSRIVDACIRLQLEMIKNPFRLIKKINF